MHRKSLDMRGRSRQWKMYVVSFNRLAANNNIYKVKVQDSFDTLRPHIYIHQSALDAWCVNTTTATFTSLNILWYLFVRECIKLFRHVSRDTRVATIYPSCIPCRMRSVVVHWEWTQEKYEPSPKPLLPHLAIQWGKHADDAVWGWVYMDTVNKHDEK